MSDLLHVFIGESRENLESASLLLEKLHSDGYSQDAIDNVCPTTPCIATCDGKGCERLDIHPVIPGNRLH